MLTDFTHILRIVCEIYTHSCLPPFLSTNVFSYLTDYQTWDRVPCSADIKPAR
jgi:hypothetical protein